MQRLGFTAVRRAVPFMYELKMQLHVRVRIHVFNRAPKNRCANLNPQFFLQLTRQGLMHGFARLEFTARKLPKPSHGLARWALRKQHFARAVTQHANGDVGDGGGHATTTIKIKFWV